MVGQRLGLGGGALGGGLALVGASAPRLDAGLGLGLGSSASSASATGRDDDDERVGVGDQGRALGQLRSPAWIWVPGSDAVDVDLDAVGMFVASASSDSVLSCW